MIGNISEFIREQIVDVHLADTCLTSTVSLCGEPW